MGELGVFPGIREAEGEAGVKADLIWASAQDSGERLPGWGAHELGELGCPQSKDTQLVRDRAKCRLQAVGYREYESWFAVAASFHGVERGNALSPSPPPPPPPPHFPPSAMSSLSICPLSSIPHHLSRWTDKDPEQHQVPPLPGAHWQVSMPTETWSPSHRMVGGRACQRSWWK